MHIRRWCGLVAGCALLLVQTGCGRAEGSRFVPGDIQNNPAVSTSLPVGVDSAALSAVIGYVDALNIAAKTGDTLALRMSAQVGCGCLKIAKSFEAIYSTANLIGATYRITGFTVVENSANEIRLRVIIAMSKAVHVNRATGVRTAWSGAITPTLFILQPIDRTWWIVQTE